MIVFPRSTVKLTMLGKESFVASPNTTVFYNQDTFYERGKLSEEGDHCEFFQFAPYLLAEIIADYAPIQQKCKAPFPFTHSFLSKNNYRIQRQLIDTLFNKRYSSQLQIDETAVALLEQVVIDSFKQHGLRSKPKRRTQEAHRRLAADAQAFLATHYQQRVSLKMLADRLYVSPYHLSRVFRQQIGCTIHHFLEQIRLRAAYERLNDYRQNLSQLALDVGYSSHSHFGEAFHRSFGRPPSVVSGLQMPEKLTTVNYY